MAQNGLSKLVFSCQCRNPMTRKITTSSRSFSSTPRNAKTIPSFNATSSPELDELLLTFRSKVFAPFAMTRRQRALMYRPTCHNLILGDPGVTVTMSDGETVKLEPRDFKDRPEKRKSLQRLLELLKEGKDWQNLPTFLRGMQMAGEKLPKGYLERFVRRAHEQGQARVIIRCMEMVDVTGVTLADRAVTRELMLQFHTRALKAGYEGEEMTDTVHQFQQILALMQKSEHCGRKAFKEGQRDMRQDSTVLGVMLALKASGKGLVESSVLFGSVQLIAAKVLANYLRQDLLTISEAPHEARQQMEGWLPVLAGIKLALKNGGVQDPLLQTGLTGLRDRLENAVERAREVVEAAAEDRSRRCLKMYDEMKDS